MTFAESLMARRIYDLERQRDERTFARDHSFEEWLDQCLRDCDAGRVEGPIHCGLGVAGHGGTLASQFWNRGVPQQLTLR